MIQDLSHMTFIVRELDRMSDILTGVFVHSGARQFSLEGVQ